MYELYIISNVLVLLISGVVFIRAIKREKATKEIYIPPIVILGLMVGIGWIFVGLLFSLYLLFK